MPDFAPCRIIPLEAVPIRDLWRADRLSLLLCVHAGFVLVDALYDELTGADRPEAREIKHFLDEYLRPVIAYTETGQYERTKQNPRKNAREIAVTDFATSDDGLDTYVASGSQVLLLVDDAELAHYFALRQPDNLHFVTTSTLLRGMEAVGVVRDAESLIGQVLAAPLPIEASRESVERIVRIFKGGDHSPAFLLPTAAAIEATVVADWLERLKRTGLPVYVTDWAFAVLEQSEDGRRTLCGFRNALEGQLFEIKTEIPAIAEQLASLRVPPDHQAIKIALDDFLDAHPGVRCALILDAATAVRHMIILPDNARLLCAGAPDLVPTEEALVSLDISK